jgi:hypothetical protein
MKTKKNILIGVGTFIMSFILMMPVRATENVEINVIEASKKIRVELESPAEAEIDVRIYNNFNRVLYTDRISAGATFDTEIDFSTFKKGTYRLVSQLGNTKYNRVLEVSDSGIEVKESYNTYVPFFIQEDDLMKIQYKNSMEENIHIEFSDNIWGEFFDVYYQDSGMSFTAIYSLQQLPRGSYTITMYSGRDKYSHDFFID